MSVTWVDLGSSAHTALRSRTSPPAATMSARRASATTVKSTMAALGTCSAAMPLTAGSISRSERASSCSTAASPFVSARLRSSSSERSSSSRTATMTFPQRVCGIARSSQNASIARAPATQKRAFALPGR